MEELKAWPKVLSFDKIKLIVLLIKKTSLFIEPETMQVYVNGFQLRHRHSVQMRSVAGFEKYSSCVLVMQLNTIFLQRS
jgi:hypothetical protein